MSESIENPRGNLLELPDWLVKEQLPDWAEPLPKWMRFAYIYALDPTRNASRAYRIAGYEVSTPESAYACASRLLRDAKVESVLTEMEGQMKQIASDQALLTYTEMFAGITAIARTTLDQVIDWDESGNYTLVPSKDLTAAQRRAIKKIQVKTVEILNEDGSGILKTTTTVELHDPLRAYAQALKLMEAARVRTVAPGAEEGRGRELVVRFVEE